MQADHLTGLLLAKLGYGDDDAKKLLRVPAEVLIAAQSDAIKEAGYHFKPVLDGVSFFEQPFLPIAPRWSAARAYGRGATLMAEARAQAENAGPTWLYQLAWRSPAEGGRRITPHSLDLPFVFDNVAAGARLASPPSAGTSAMTDQMANSWIAFARHRNPNNPAIPQWDPYHSDQRDSAPPDHCFDPHSMWAHDHDATEATQKGSAPPIPNQLDKIGWNFLSISGILWPIGRCLKGC